MKRHIVTVSLLSTILGAGAINSQAAPPPNHPENIAQAPKGDVPHSDRMGPSASADFQRETNFLHLNADQQKKISGILAEQREKVSPLIKKLDHLRLQLHEAELATNLDEPGLQVTCEETVQNRNRAYYFPCKDEQKSHGGPDKRPA